MSNGRSTDNKSLYAALEKLPPTPCPNKARRHSAFINRVAVKAGYVAPHDKSNPGWHITAEGREYLSLAADKGSCKLRRGHR